MSSDSALLRGKEIRLRICHLLDNTAGPIAASTVEVVENFVEGVDNFPYPNLYPLLWKPILPGEKRRKALKFHGPDLRGRRPAFEGYTERIALTEAGKA